MRPAPIGLGVFATGPIASADWVIELPRVFDDRPGCYTIQLDEHHYQAYTGEADDFVNHACDPNTYLDVDGLRLVARRAIAAGEEITLHYATFEWELVDPFVCVCDGVARSIRGFRVLSTAERLRLADGVPAWLRGRAQA